MSIVAKWSPISATAEHLYKWSPPNRLDSTREAEIDFSRFIRPDSNVEKPLLPLAVSLSCYGHMAISVNSASSLSLFSSVLPLATERISLVQVISTRTGLIQSGEKPSEYEMKERNEMLSVA